MGGKVKCDDWFRFYANRLLLEYGYVFFTAMSEPHLPCKLVFNPTDTFNYEKALYDTFCQRHCFLLPKSDFEQLYKFVFQVGQISEEDLKYLICCENPSDKYIKGIKSSDGNEKSLDYAKRVDERKLKKLRKEYFKYPPLHYRRSLYYLKEEQYILRFWIFAYIYLGYNQRNQFIQFLGNDDSKYNNKNFKHLISEFDRQFSNPYDPSFTIKNLLISHQY